MEPLAKVFANVHGLRFKSTFAETLVHILHPISKVCSYFPLTRRSLMAEYIRLLKQKRTTLNGPRRLRSSTRELEK